MEENRIDRVYLDLETINRDPLKAEILEACFLFTNDKKQIIKEFHSKIKINKLWKNLTKEELGCLEFNNIKSKTEFDFHNQIAENFDFFFKTVMDFYFTNKIRKAPLTGWNNSGFDNIILQRSIYPNCLYEFFDYHTRDLMHYFRRGLKEIGVIKGDSLSGTHLDLIGTREKNTFHSSKIDCLAVKELDDWLDENYKDLMWDFGENNTVRDIIKDIFQVILEIDENSRQKIIIKLLEIVKNKYRFTDADIKKLNLKHYNKKND